MRLKRIEKGAGLKQKFVLLLMRFVIGVRVPDILRLFQYRSKFFGKPYSAFSHAVMRGKSEWSVGERELFAAFTSHLNSCRYCYCHHSATSVKSLEDESLVQAVMNDWQTAPVNQKMKAMLGFLKKMTLEPFNMVTEDLAPLRTAGLSDAAIEDAIHICASFNIINRIADVLDFELPGPEGVARSTEILLTRGYK